MINMRRGRFLQLSLICLALGLASLIGSWLAKTRQRASIFPLLSSSTNHTKVTNTTSLSDVEPITYNDALIPYWGLLSQALLDAKPQCSLPEDDLKTPLAKFAGLRKYFNSRPDLLKLSQRDVDDLRIAHSRFVSQISGLAAGLPYAKGTKGIVTTAAMETLPVLVVSLRMLRRTGSIMPVQVFMKSEKDYENDVCERILPKLNATCWLLSDVWDKVAQQPQMIEEQMKVFAMLFSSFDEMVWMDADNIAVQMPERLLEGEAFASGLVTWPDYWANTASPRYYEISSQATPKVTARAASDPGNLLLSKSKHASTLLLALYYNYYGPSQYYKLLLQGAPGPKDKETYLAAAMALNSDFYTLHSNVEILGYRNEDNKFQACGDVQFDPTDDHQKHVLGNKTIKDISRVFVHAQTYKMDAADADEWFHRDVNQRMWGPKEDMVKRFGRDLEKQLWAETLYTGCHLGNFRAWENRMGVCKKVGRIYKFLFD